MRQLAVAEVVRLRVQRTAKLRILTNPATPHSRPRAVYYVSLLSIFEKIRQAEMSECNFDDSRIDEGISLFNAGEFFACHDVLEDFWGELTCPEKPFFQGLIQAAVALFHFEEGNLGGARRMAGSCRVYLSPFAPSCGGVNVERLLADLQACFQELLEEHASYPVHLKIDLQKVPKIHRAAR